MLLIRSQQMKVFESEMERRFIDRMVETFSRSHKQIESLRERIRKAATRSREYGIQADPDIQWFVALDLDRGASWETVPGMEWALDILDSPGVEVSGLRFRLEKRLQKWDEYARR
jgi:hypothetical protein